MTTRIDLTELGEALPHDVQKILINIDDEEYDWIFLAHETVDMVTVFTVHAQQYNMLPTNFCYTIGDYQLYGHETPRTLGLRAEDVIVATWLPDGAPAVDSFSSNFPYEPADSATHDPSQHVEYEDNRTVKDEDEEEEEVEDEEEEEVEDGDIDESPFDPEEWEERNRQIRAMIAAHDSTWGSLAVNQQQPDEWCLVEDEQSMQTVKDKDDDVEMTD